MRPTTRFVAPLVPGLAPPPGSRRSPPPTARNACTLACSKNGLRRVSNIKRTSTPKRRHPHRIARIQPPGEVDEAREVARRLDGADVDGHRVGSRELLAARRPRVLVSSLRDRVSAACRRWPHPMTPNSLPTFVKTSITRSSWSRRVRRDERGADAAGVRRHGRRRRRSWRTRRCRRGSSRTERLMKSPITTGMIGVSLVAVSKPSELEPAAQVVGVRRAALPAARARS